jgi:hypothetical protein
MEVFIRRSRKTARGWVWNHTPDNFAFSGTQLILQEKVVFEQREIKRNAKKCFTEMDEDDDLKNGVRVEMD